MGGQGGMHGVGCVRSASLPAPGLAYSCMAASSVHGCMGAWGLGPAKKRALPFWSSLSTWGMRRWRAERRG